MIIEVANPNTGVEEAVSQMLSEDAQSNGQHYQPELIVLQVRDDAQIVAGLVGHTNWDWLYIETLAVDSEYQGKGLGRELVLEAERIAIQRNCVGAWVDTYTFQSPEFYRRLGYEQFGELPNCPRDQKRLFLRKRFDKALVD